MRTNHKIIFAAAVVLAGCSKDLPLNSLEFDASAEKPAINAGDTAKFIFSGNPDVITFYSGEPGKQYQFRNRISDTSTNVQLKFSTATTVATSGSLQLMISDNLVGAIDSINVPAANWTDITNRATLATGTATVASGTISLADFAANKKPVYIAFKYTAAAAATQRKWTITGLTLTHVLADQTVHTIANMTSTTPSPGWVPVNVQNYAVNWTPALVITGATTVATAVATEDWIVMGPIDLSRTLPDQGVAIKNYGEGMNKFPFLYKYSTAGSYKAVFVASNVNRDAQETKVKEVAITVQ